MAERPQVEPVSPNLYPPESYDVSSTPPPQAQRVDIDELAVCASPGDFVAPKKKSGVRDTKEHESMWNALRKVVMEHQLGLSLNFILLLAMSHVLFPSLRSVTKACFTLSYATEAPGQYGQGPRDMYLVGSWIIYFMAIRAFMLDYILMPLASFCGIGRRKGRVRFAEQAYMMLYYALYWSWGLYLFYKDTPQTVNSVESLLLSLWRDFPRLTMPAGVKIYYLSQFAFWLQQIVVIHLEEARKDHYQMLTHHFVTCTLMLGSYGYRQWRVGNALLVCMDSVDLALPLAKILRYLGLQTACDCMFGVFTLTWIAARHVAYMAIVWSIWAHVNVKTMQYGLYSTVTGERLSSSGGENLLDNLMQPITRPEAKTVSFNANIQNLFLGLLLALQGITIVWFVMIVRVIIRVIRGQGADDTRSDDEGEDEDVENGPVQPSKPSVPITEPEKPRFIEIETTSEDVTWPTRKGSSSNSGRKKSKGISSGLNLGEHKEILNRIGCLSEEQLAREREKRTDSASPRP